MRIAVICRQCDCKLGAPGRMAGRQVLCPQCKTAIDLPPPPAAPAAPSSAPPTGLIVTQNARTANVTSSPFDFDQPEPESEATSENPLAFDDDSTMVRAVSEDRMPRDEPTDWNKLWLILLLLVLALFWLPIKVNQSTRERDRVAAARREEDQLRELMIQGNMTYDEAATICDRADQDR